MYSSPVVDYFKLLMKFSFFPFVSDKYCSNNDVSGPSEWDVLPKDTDFKLKFKTPVKKC